MQLRFVTKLFSFTKSSITSRDYSMPGASNVKENVQNVFKRPLAQHGTDPMTGYYRTGFCETDQSDHGKHLIAGIVSEEFLDFSAKRGNNLRPAGLSGGCRWCLCVDRWKEAFTAYKSGEVSKVTVPKIDLEATHIKALSSGVTLEDLKSFSFKAEDRNSPGREL